MRAIFKKLLDAAPSGSLDLATVLGGTFTRNLLRGIFKILIAGFLAPQALGILRAIYSLFKITTSLVDFALDYAAVTFVSAAIKRDDTEEREQTLAAVLALKLLIATALMIVGGLVARPISVGILGDGSLTLYVRLAFVAVAGQLLWRYVSGFLSAHQRFGNLAFFLTTVPALMLISAGILILVGRFSLFAAILINLFAPAAAVALWWPAVRGGIPRLSGWTSSAMGKVIRFSRWVYLSTVASSSRNNLNTILLKNPALSGSVAAGELNAGLYSFGNDLANEVTVISQSLLSVLLPKASRKTDVGRLRQFVKRSYGYLALAAVPLVLLVFAAKPFILLLAQIKESYLEYMPSLTVFAILYIGALLSVASIPMKTALYSMKLPQAETYVELVLIPLFVVGGILLIPRYGSEGAAYVVLAQRVISFVAIMTYGLVKLREPGRTA